MGECLSSFLLHSGLWPILWSILASHTVVTVVALRAPFLLAKNLTVAHDCASSITNFHGLRRDFEIRNPKLRTSWQEPEPLRQTSGKPKVVDVRC